MRVIQALLIVLCVAVGAAADDDAGPTSEATLARQAFAGLSLRDIPDSPYSVISWILPGPFEGSGFESKYVSRGDVLLAVNGEPRTAEQFKALLESSSPGEVLRFRVQRGTGDINAAVPDPGGEQGEIVDFEVTLGSREQWVGPIGRPLPQRSLPQRQEGDLERTLRLHAAEQGISAGLEDLVALFAQTQRENLGRHALDRVVAGFLHPLSVDTLGAEMIAETQAIARSPLAGAHRLIAANLDLGGGAAAGVSDAAVTCDSVDALVAALRGRVAEAATHGAGAVIEPRLAEQAMRLVNVLARDVYIFNDPAEAPAHIEVLRASLNVEFDDVAAQAAALYPAPLRLAPEAAAGADPVEHDVTGLGGDVLFVGRTPQGLIVIGGPGDNTYLMDDIAAVYDVGGNDGYVFAEPRVGRSTLIIDDAGRDIYRGEGAFAGPASAIVGAAVIHDRQGDDRYEGTRCACAAGLFGVGMIIDENGHDVYEAQDWSQGAALFGAGVLVDLDGNDEYLGETRVQGVGGTKALGAIIDAAGNDLYRANGPHGSVYGTPAVYVGFSQAIGYGIRQYASGGVGLISDLSGHDRYEAGEFSQGGGYYWCLGLLHDAAGDDLYYGNRYGQGFGCHQSIGMLIDEAGDDTYWSMTAASQGGSWDIGVGLLLDKAGNDAYRADGLSQGSASMQAIGLLVDGGGQDRYSGKGGATQGQGGGNSYHYNRTGCFSFSALIDCGDAIDFFSSGRTNDSLASTGQFNENSPEGSNLHGLFIDGLEQLDISEDAGDD